MNYLLDTHVILWMLSSPDRMLIAEAIQEGLTLITHDKKFEAYDVPILWT